MAIKIIGTIIGALIMSAGIYYLVKEKHDAESKKIYGIVTAIGAAIFVVMLVLVILSSL